MQQTIGIIFMLVLLAAIAIVVVSAIATLVFYFVAEYKLKHWKNRR